MTLTTSGVRQASVWTNVVSDDAERLRDWLLGLGFTLDLEIPGERGGATPERFSYMRIWKRTDDGSWAIVVDVANALAAPAPAPATPK